MQACSLLWRSLPRAGLVRRCTSLAIKSEAAAADVLVNEAAPSTSELAAADHLQSPLAQATIEALKPEGEAVPMVPLDQLEDLDGLYQSLTSPLAPQHRSRLERHQKLREVNTDPEAFWSRNTPSVESFDHLIRACGMQEQIPRARAYFDEMEFVGVAPATTRPSNHRPDPSPDPNTEPYPRPNQAASTYAALIGAHARVGDVGGARAVLDMAVQELTRTLTLTLTPSLSLALTLALAPIRSVAQLRVEFFADPELIILSEVALYSLWPYLPWLDSLY
jgi:pentatricopeptide repeat protein